MNAALADLKVIAFDIFGTVVDWHGGIAAEVERALPGVDGAEFALAWRAGYQPAMREAMARMASGAAARAPNGSSDGSGDGAGNSRGSSAGAGRDPGEVSSENDGFTLIGTLHRRILDRVLQQRQLAHRLSETQKRDLNLAWHRLPAWPDAVAGLTRLKRKFTICTLSNGHIGLLTEMAKRAGLPWDCVLSAEVFRAYKPDPRTYLGVARVFDLPPAEVMLAAAHHDDLAGARACGLLTAYIERPFELGTAQQPKDVSPQPGNTLHARDIGALAEALGC